MSARKLKVFLTEPVNADAQAALAAAVDLRIGHPDLDAAELRRCVADVDVIFSKTDPIAINAELMDGAPSLRLIARHGSGYSNIDVDHATRRGIAITTTPGVNAVSIAEYTIGLMLAVARRIPEAAAGSREGDPDRFAFMGPELYGKTFGIAGVGSIGRAVVERVRALGMKVLAYHPRPSARNLADLDIELVDLPELLAQSDVVSLHVPLTEATRNLIGRDELALMKPTAILLNLSRGGVVDEAALRAALEEDVLFGAATDVLANEPVRADEPLLSARNCLVMPHIAAVTGEAQRAIAFAAVDEILRLGRGEPLLNVVNPEALEVRK